MDIKERQIPAGQFKQHCLAIIDQVARTHRPVVISKRGKPMAKLVAVETDEEIERHILTRLREGEGGMLVDERSFLQPSSQIAGWTDP
jgi:prevent-host-death family protein